MEISIMKDVLSAFVDSIAVPLKMIFHICSVRLLLNTLIHILFGITNLGPSDVLRNSRCGVCINLRNYRNIGLNFISDVWSCVHQFISLTCVSIKSISSSLRSYFL